MASGILELVRNVREDADLVLDQEVQDHAEVHPTVGFLRALGLHLDDKSRLVAQVDGQRVHVVDPRAALQPLGEILHDQIHLVRKAPNPHDLRPPYHQAVH